MKKCEKIVNYQNAIERLRELGYARPLIEDIEKSLLGPIEKIRLGPIEKIRSAEPRKPRPRRIKVRRMLELDDGAFYATEKVLASPELQARCIEKRQLNRLLRRIEDGSAYGLVSEEKAMSKATGAFIGMMILVGATGAYADTACKVTELCEQCMGHEDTGGAYEAACKDQAQAKGYELMGYRPGKLPLCDFIQKFDTDVDCRSLKLEPLR